MIAIKQRDPKVYLRVLGCRWEREEKRPSFLFYCLKVELKKTVDQHSSIKDETQSTHKMRIICTVVHGVQFPPQRRAMMDRI